jgi:hypothetical protein
MKRMIIASLIAATFLTPAVQAAETPNSKTQRVAPMGADTDDGATTEYRRGGRGQGGGGWQQAPQGSDNQGSGRRGGWQQTPQQSQPQPQQTQQQVPQRQERWRGRGGGWQQVPEQTQQPAPQQQDGGRGRGGNRGWQQAPQQPAPQPQGDWRGRGDGRQGGYDRRREEPVYQSDRETGVEPRWNDRGGPGQDNRGYDQRRNDGRGYGNNGYGNRQDDRGYDNNHYGNRRDDRSYDNRGWSNNDRRGYDNGRHDNRRWDNSWRNDRRYNWRGHRDQYRDHYRIGRYYAPDRYSRYSRFNIGFYIGRPYYHNNYWLSDPWSYRLPQAYGPYRWVRYYDDVLLIDVRNGYVVDVIHSFFW